MTAAGADPKPADDATITAAVRKAIAYMSRRRKAASDPLYLAAAAGAARGAPEAGRDGPAEFQFETACRACGISLVHGRSGSGAAIGRYPVCHSKTINPMNTGVFSRP